MASKEEDFKQRFVEILRDLQSEGSKDFEAMWLIGSLAAELIDRTGHKSWTEFKRGMDQPTYTRLLTDFEAEGNRQYREGEQKKAYAIQALAVSIVAPTQADGQIRAGDRLLDGLIEQTIDLYRKNRDRARPLTN